MCVITHDANEREADILPMSDLMPIRDHAVDSVLSLSRHEALHPFSGLWIKISDEVTQLATVRIRESTQATLNKAGNARVGLADREVTEDVTSRLLEETGD